MYIERMLTRFVESSNLFQSYDFHGEKKYGLKPITLQHFELTSTEFSSSRESGLQKLAEECLFLVGYCYDHVRRNGIGSVHFHRDVGSVAYDSLGALTGVQTYPEVAESFDEYAVVIGDLHVPGLRKDRKKLKVVLDRWMETRDQRYALLLEAAVEGDRLVFDTSGRKEERN